MWDLRSGCFLCIWPGCVCFGCLGFVWWVLDCRLWCVVMVGLLVDYFWGVLVVCGVWLG